MSHSAASAPWVTQVARSTDAPRFIFFDLGGVIALFDRNIAIRQISAAADISIDVVREFLCDTDLQHRHESGEVDQNEFYAAFCAATGTHCSLDKLLAAGNQMFTLNVRILPIIANLAMTGHRLGILSNTCVSHWEYCHSKYSVLRHAFAVNALSYEIGAIKPDPTIYAAAAQLAGVARQEIFFTDDRIENVVAAREAGFDAEQFISPRDLAHGLRSRGVRLNY